MIGNNNDVVPHEHSIIQASSLQNGHDKDQPQLKSASHSFSHRRFSPSGFLHGCKWRQTVALATSLSWAAGVTAHCVSFHQLVKPLRNTQLAIPWAAAPILSKLHGTLRLVGAKSVAPLHHITFPANPTVHWGISSTLLKAIPKVRFTSIVVPVSCTLRRILPSQWRRSDLIQVHARDMSFAMVHMSEAMDDDEPDDQQNSISISVDDYGQMVGSSINRLEVFQDMAKKLMGELCKDANLDNKLSERDLRILEFDRQVKKLLADEDHDDDDDDYGNRSVKQSNKIYDLEKMLEKLMKELMTDANLDNKLSGRDLRILEFDRQVKNILDKHDNADYDSDRLVYRILNEMIPEMEEMLNKLLNELQQNANLDNKLSERDLRILEFDRQVKKLSADEEDAEDYDRFIETLETNVQVLSKSLQRQVKKLWKDANLDNKLSERDLSFLEGRRPMLYYNSRAEKQSSKFDSAVAHQLWHIPLWLKPIFINTWKSSWKEHKLDEKLSQWDRRILELHFELQDLLKNQPEASCDYEEKLSELALKIKKLKAMQKKLSEAFPKCN